MALKEHYWEFKQTEPAAVWEVNNVPDGALYPAIDRVLLSGGRIFVPGEDDQLVAPYGIQLSFGVTPETGTAVGKYFTDEDAPQTISSGANNVTISITQNGGDTPSGTTF